jgi:hypothetical protein
MTTLYIISAAAAADEIIRQIVKPTIEAGGDLIDVLVLLESVVAGTLVAITRFGGDDQVLDTLSEAVRTRMAKMRLADMSSKGESWPPSST